MTGIQHIQSWIGGKDSTASIVLEHMHRDDLGIPPSKIVMAEVMFDNARGISDEHPELWEELDALARVPNKVSEYFKYNMTFWDVAAAVEQYLAMPEQLTLF